MTRTSPWHATCGRRAAGLECLMRGAPEAERQQPCSVTHEAARLPSDKCPRTAHLAGQAQALVAGRRVRREVQAQPLRRCPLLRLHRALHLHRACAAGAQPPAVDQRCAAVVGCHACLQHGSPQRRAALRLRHCRGEAQLLECALPPLITTSAEPLLACTCLPRYSIETAAAAPGSSSLLPPPPAGGAPPPAAAAARCRAPWFDRWLPRSRVGSHVAGPAARRACAASAPILPTTGQLAMGDQLCEQLNA